MDRAWLPYWPGSPDERPSLYLSLWTPPLCLSAPFSLNSIVVFLSCPGSRYHLTKYFMAHSTPYLPTVSYLLSEIKGSFFGGGGEGEKKRERSQVYSLVFMGKFLRCTQRTETRRLYRWRLLCAQATAGHLFIYLRAYLFIRRRGPPA